jgi:hypothetical protein
MTWPRLAAISAAALVLAAPVPGMAAVHGKAVSAALAASGPHYAAGARLCAAGTTHFRIIWDETRGSKQRPAGKKGKDGKCSTVPSRVTAIALQVERMRRAELRLGFRPPARDGGLRRNGGDGRYDIYLSKQRPGVLGQTACTYASLRGRIGRRWSSTEIGSVAPRAVDPDRLLRETLAHEYFHAIQCRIVPRLDLLPGVIVEGTANWMAANVVTDWARAEGSFLSGLGGRMEEAARSPRSIAQQTYSSWGFWYEATSGSANPGLIRNLFQRSARRTHRANADTEIRAVVKSLEPTLMRYALALRSAFPLAAVHLPPSYAARLRPPSPMLDLTDGPSSQTQRVLVRAIGYRFPGVAWGDDSGTITLRIAGARASSVAVLGSPRPMQGQSPDGALTFTIDGDHAGQVTIVLVNATRGPRTVTISASH